MASSLFLLIDDIATVLDDVALLSKVAAKKTASVLGDDLALNAQQVAGVKAERELPVVWAVAKGSFINKAILVPSALVISSFAPWAVTPLLMAGGAYLCFEGFEKLAHKYLHNKGEQAAEHQAMVTSLADPVADLVAIEKEKIKGAVRTDFILSAEIIVITLGTVQASPFVTQVTVLSGIAVYDARLRLGNALAEQILEEMSIDDIDVVMPIPDSARPSAMQVAQKLGLPYREVFLI